MKRESELVSTGVVASTDELRVIQGGVSKRALLSGQFTFGTIIVNALTITNFSVVNLTLSGDLTTPGNISGNLFRAGDGTVGAPAYSFTNSTGSGFYWNGINSLLYAQGGVNIFGFNSGGITMQSAKSISFFPDGTGILRSDASNSIAMRNGGNTQIFYVYGTHTDGSNYERLTTQAVGGGSVSILTEGLGTGIARSLSIGTAGTAGALDFVTGGTARWRVAPSASGSHLFAFADNTYDIGATGANRPRSLFVGTSITVAGILIAPGAGNSVSLAVNTGNFQVAGGDVGGSGNILLFGGLEATTPSEIRFRQGTGIIWKIATSTGHLLAGTDNTYDIGAVGATRPRSIYVGTSFISSGSGAGNTAGLQVAAVAPGMSLSANTQAADNRMWDILVQNLQYNFRTVNDANSIANVWLSALRSGLAVTQISFFGGATLAEQLRITPVSAASAYINLGGGAGTATIAAASAGANAGLSLAAQGSGTLTLTIGTGDIQWGKALVALGGGAGPTFGTIGGSGPATAAQNTWMRVLDSTGAAFFVPAWK